MSVPKERANQTTLEAGHAFVYSSKLACHTFLNAFCVNGSSWSRDFHTQHQTPPTMFHPALISWLQNQKIPSLFRDCVLNEWVVCVNLILSEQWDSFGDDEGVCVFLPSVCRCLPVWLCDWRCFYCVTVCDLWAQCRVQTWTDTPESQRSPHRWSKPNHHNN